MKEIEGEKKNERTGNTLRCQSLTRWQWVNDDGCPSKVKILEKKEKNHMCLCGCEQIRLSTKTNRR